MTYDYYENTFFFHGHLENVSGAISGPRRTFENCYSRGTSLCHAVFQNQDSIYSDTMLSPIPLAENLHIN